MTQSSTLKAQDLFLRIADITIALLGNDSELKFELEEATKRFLVPDAYPDMSIRARWSDLFEETGGEKIFDSGSLWQLYHDNGFYLFRFASSTYGPAPYKIARFNRDFTSGEVYLHRAYFPPGQPVYALEYPLDELLIVNLLAKGKGVEVHACGVVDPNGNGHLFVGQSEAGKTTMANLWQNEPGITVLSDDRIILRKIGETFWMYGTPWHGEAGLSSPARAPLKRVYFLYHGKKNKLIQQGGAEALARLFACSFPPFFDPFGVEYTLRFYEEVIKLTPCFEIRFLPDKSVVQFILND